MKATPTIYNPETLLVMSDGELLDEYYDAIYAEKRREALHQLGSQAVELMTRPIRNLSLNILDLLSS